jgi:hypothetical protein
MQPGPDIRRRLWQLLAQIARRNFPNFGRFFATNQIRNRAAQSDYVTSLIEIRQNELGLHKSVNQVRVDANAVIGLTQAARAARRRQARKLAQQTLMRISERFNWGRRHRIRWCRISATRPTA